MQLKVLSKLLYLTVRVDADGTPIWVTSNTRLLSLLQKKY